MSMTNRDGKYVDVDGIKTFYFKAGTGFPLVLIHGASPGACSVTGWQLNIEPLARVGFSVYAFDQPGFGMTDNPQDHSIEYRVTHAKAFLNAVKLDRYHVVGNSVDFCFLISFPTRSFISSTAAPTGFNGIRRTDLTIWSPTSWSTGFEL